MSSKKTRNIKVISQSGHNYKPTPTIILKGQWLNEMGFEIGDCIKVECENGRLVVSLDKERVTELEAKKAFMDAEMEKVTARYEKEKKQIYAQYVAEKEAGCLKPGTVLYIKSIDRLWLFLSNIGIVLTRDMIMGTVWESDYAGETRTVDMHIKTLRKKLGDAGALIVTIRNVGYKME